MAEFDTLTNGIILSSKSRDMQRHFGLDNMFWIESCRYVAYSNGHLSVDLKMEGWKEE